MRKVRLSEFRSFVRRVLAEADMKKNPETTGRTAYNVANKLLYVEWDDGDKKSIAVYDVKAEDDGETPWFDYDGDSNLDKNPAKLAYKETVSEFPGGLKILTPEDAIAAAKAYKRKNPDADINTVNLLSNPLAGPVGVRNGAQKNLVAAAGGTLQAARPDFYKRKADAKSGKAATTAPAASTPAAPAAPTDAAPAGGSRTGISSSPIKSSLRVKKGDYGFTLKFNNTSRGPITIFVYLLTGAEAQGLGMPEDRLVPGPREIPGSAESSYVNNLTASPGATLSFNNLFSQEGFKNAKNDFPNREYVFLRYYRGTPGKEGEVDWSKTAATSLSKLYKDTAK